MGLELVKLKKEHLEEMMKHDKNAYLRLNWNDQQKDILVNGPHHYAIVGNNEVFMVGGVIEYWQNRGEAWAATHPDCSKHFISIQRIAKRFLEVCPVRRIEATVIYDHEAGHKWVRTLGFTKEADRLRAYRLDGKDVALYSKVRV